VKQKCSHFLAEMSKRFLFAVEMYEHFFREKNGHKKYVDVIHDAVHIHRKIKL